MGGSGRSHNTDLHQCLLDIDLFDLPFKGSLYTWSNRRDSEQIIARKLDRVLVNDSWLATFPNSEADFTGPGSFQLCPSKCRKREFASFDSFDSYGRGLPQTEVQNSVGDSKTGFFHKVVRARQSKNRLLSVYNAEGEKLEDHKAVSQEAVSFFQLGGDPTLERDDSSASISFSGHVREAASLKAPSLDDEASDPMELTGVSSFLNRQGKLLATHLLPIDLLKLTKGRRSASPNFSVGEQTETNEASNAPAFSLPSCDYAIPSPGEQAGETRVPHLFILPSLLVQFLCLPPLGSLKCFFSRPSPSLSSAPDLSPGEPSTLSFYPIPTLASFWLAEGWLFKDSKLYPVSTRRLIPLSQHPRKGRSLNERKDQSAYRGLLAVIGLKIPHFTTDSGTKDSVKPPAIDWSHAKASPLPQRWIDGLKSPIPDSLDISFFEAFHPFLIVSLKTSSNGHRNNITKEDETANPLNCQARRPEIEPKNLDGTPLFKNPLSPVSTKASSSRFDPLLDARSGTAAFSNFPPESDGCAPSLTSTLRTGTTIRGIATTTTYISLLQFQPRKATRTAEWSIPLPISRFSHVSKRAISRPFAIAIRAARLYTAWLRYRSVGLKSRIPTIQECLLSSARSFARSKQDEYGSLSARTAHTPRSSRHLLCELGAAPKSKAYFKIEIRFQQHHKKSKLWLPTDLIIGEIQSLRFAPGLETNNKVSFIAPIYTRGKPKPAEGRAS
ncbi:hypothetical protein ACOSQ2_003241 [Xanthoceras sorbifolium]